MEDNYFRKAYSSITGICPVQKKRCYTTYKKCLKAARETMRNDKSRDKSNGSNSRRNMTNMADNDFYIYKVCRSVYICKYCGYFHWPSMKTKRK